jgi:uncharacterized membrane-anchored protein
VRDLAGRFGAAPPKPGANYYSADLGPFRLKWERHTEFIRYKFIVAGAGDDPFAEPAIAAVPGECGGAAWDVVVATHAAILPAGGEPVDSDAVSARFFSGHTLIGAAVAGAAVALTDFRIHRDGFGRLLVLDRGMTRRQAGRTVQRLLEIDTYRMLALLALPVARELSPVLTGYERELAEITTALTDVGEADSHYRFSAAGPTTSW